MEDILQIMGYLPDQLPQDFFHQQYEVYTVMEEIWEALNS